MEVYQVVNCVDETIPVTCNSFEVAEKLAQATVTAISLKSTDTIKRDNMVWSFSNGIVAVYIQRIYIGRFHTDVVQLNKKLDILLNKVEPFNDFIKKIDELLNMKIIVAKE